MGQLLSLVKGRDPVQIFVDFENAKPGSHETDLYERAQAVLSRAPEMLVALEQYKGCQDLARKSMSTPTLANETEAFEGLLEAVDSVNMFFLYSKELEQLVPELLQRLSRETTESTRDSFLEQQCLVRQLADVFNFALCFDQTRMLRPYLSNDFSYYRRLLAKFNKHPAIKVRDDDASGMALFTAEHIPMTTCIARAAAQALERNLHVTHTLSVMANTCVGMLKNTEQPVPDRIKLFLARAATGAIICFDHVDPLGAFHKKSPIRVKRAASLFKKDLPSEPGLLNALRYSTKHFADADAATQAVFQS